MKKFIFLLGAMLLATSTGAFAADGRVYVGGSAGLFIPNDSTVTDDAGDTGKATFDTGIVFNGFGGYAFGNGFRVEGELAFRRAEFDRLKVPGFVSEKIDSSVWATSAMANAYYDIKTQSRITPFVGGGIGFTRVDVDRGRFSDGSIAWNSDDDTVFSYQIGAGAGFEVNKHVTIDLAYRFFATEDVHFDLSDAEFGSHNVTVGVRYLF